MAFNTQNPKRFLKILTVICLISSGPIFWLLLGVSSNYAQPNTGQVTEVTCPVIGCAQPELTPCMRQKMGPGHLKLIKSDNNHRNLKEYISHFQSHYANWWLNSITDSLLFNAWDPLCQRWTIIKIQQFASSFCIYHLPEIVSLISKPSGQFHTES